MTDMSSKDRRIETEESANRIRKLLRYDPATGHLYWREGADGPGGARKRKPGKIAGWVDPTTGYRRVTIDLKVWRSGRLAWLLHTGEWPKGEVDHWNGIRDDDRWSNLRDAVDGQNAQNRAMNRNNTSGFMGVYFNPQTGKWRAQINAEGKRWRLGNNFRAPEAAHAAYLAAKEKLHLFQPIPRDQ